MLPVPPQGYLSESEAKAALRLYIFGNKYDPVILPKRADPQHADDYVREALDNKKLGVIALHRCADVIRFFDLRQRAEQFTNFMARRPADDQFLHALHASRYAAAFGDDPLQARALEQYQTLLGLPPADQNLPALIDGFFEMPMSADAKIVDDALAKRMKDLEPKRATDQDAEVAYLDLQDLRKDRLASVVAARAKRSAIEKQTALDRKRFDVAQLYLGLETVGYVDVSAWAAMMLQRDCNATAPAELAAIFTRGLDMIASRIKPRLPLPPEDEKDARIYVTRCVHAIEFYGGATPSAQDAFVQKFKNDDQQDLLHWDEQSQPSS